MGRWIAVLAVCTALAAAAGCAWAVDIKSGQSVIVGKDQAANDDILAAGADVSINPAVEGDVVAAGRTVAVTGAVKDSAMLAGRNVILAGPVGNDSWLAGQTVAVTSAVKDNGFMVGSMVTLSRDGSVGKDLLAAGSTVTVLGQVGRDLRAAGEVVTIGGTVGRDVYAQGGKVTVMKGAVINGNLWYESRTKAVIEPGAKVLGKTIQSIPARERAKPIFWRPFGRILGLLMAIVFGAALIALFPIRAQGTADTVRGSFWASLGIGFVALIGTPILAVILMITIVGIPVALAALLIYLVLLYAAWIFAAMAIGQWILSKRANRVPRPFGSMILGLLILAIIGPVPFIGGLVKFVAMLVGLGGFLMSWWHSRTPAVAPPVASDPQPG